MTRTDFGEIVVDDRTEPCPCPDQADALHRLDQVKQANTTDTVFLDTYSFSGR